MVYERIPWQDRFKPPSPKQLRENLPEGSVELFDHARSHLKTLDGIRETIGWYGQSWCWALEYRLKTDEDPLAIIIPSPADLQMAMPLDVAFITTLPVQRMKRAIRDGLDLASEPFDTHWGVWSIGQQNLLDDLEDLTNRRLKHLAARNS